MTALPVARMVAEFNANVARFGTDGILRPGVDQVAVKVGRATVRDTDAAIVNALGVGARILTLRALDIGAAPPPTRFDTLSADGRLYVLDFVNSVYIQSTLWGWRCYCATVDQ